MNRRSTALLALFAVVLLAAPVGVALGQDAGTAANASSTDDELTLDELKQDGPHQANSPPSVRMGDRSLYWVVFWPANNPFADPGGVEGGEFLPPDHTVGRNAVYLRTWTYEDRQQTVNVVYWTKGERTVTTGNTTTTQAVAENVTHVTHEVTFDRGRPTVEIPLQHHDQPVRVTMWLEGEPYARWTFKHHSIATTQAVSINSAGDYLSKVIVDFLWKIVVGGFLVAALVEGAIRRAGRGTGYGYGAWITGITIATGILSLVAYQSVADLVVNAPTIIAGYVVLIFGIIMLETREHGVSKAAFLKFGLSHAESPTGSDGHDILDHDARVETIIRQGREVILIKDGLFPFLSRVFGSAAKLRNVQHLRTRVPGGNSPWDELFLVDPESDHTLFYEPEGWTFRLPDATLANVPQYGLVLASLGIAGWAISSGTANTLAVIGVTGLGLFAWAATPKDGVAAVAPAPMHLKTAYSAALMLSEETADAKTIDEAKDTIDELRLSRHRDVEEELEKRDRTLINQSFDVDLPATIREAREDAIEDNPAAEGRREPAATDGGEDDEQ